MRIFICHASEDKESFVQPLAEALRSGFDVWYDEWTLTIGDSLLKKINEGLTSCDFAVVVLSPSFFNKRWPQAELDGLFALEETTGKMILPIWKDLSGAEVAKFSPILAGRLAARAADGVPQVVAEIRRAIEVSTRTREISASDSVLQKAKSVSRALEEKQNAEYLLRTVEGVSLILKSEVELTDYFVKFSFKLEEETQGLRLNVVGKSFVGGSPSDFMVCTNFGLRMEIMLIGYYRNSAEAAELYVRMQQIDKPGPGTEPRQLGEFVFKPTFRLPKSVAWTKRGAPKMYSTEQLATYLIGELLSHIERNL
jgi:hypothetical protein